MTVAPTARGHHRKNALVSFKFESSTAVMSVLEESFTNVSLFMRCFVHISFFCHPAEWQTRSCQLIVSNFYIWSGYRVKTASRLAA